MPSKAFGKHLRACSNSYQLCEGALGGGEAAPAQREGGMG